MILCIEIDQDTKTKLDQLLKGGEYRDYSQAVAVAIVNQLLLHDRFSQGGGALVVDNGSTSQQNVRADYVSVPRIPKVFERPAEHGDLKFAPVPGDAFVRGAAVPVDRWIFGQHNKLLPAKASCRWLANLSGTKGIPLAKAAPDIAACSVELGDYLQSLDEKSGLTRDELLAGGFPLKSRDSEGKARLRYANQFVGSVNKHGQLSGLLIDLKLVNYVPGRDARLMLTEPGWRFAAAENPIFDLGADRPPKFSEDEVVLLLEHIRLHVPPEDFALGRLLRLS